MANAIGRLRSIGIAKQTTFDANVTVSSYVLDILNAPSVKVTVNKLENNGALGNSYMTNDIENGNRMATFDIEAKVDERQLPLILRQRFSISTVTVSGDANAYQHTLSYADTTNNWYTVFLHDTNRTSYRVKNALFNNINITLDGDYVKLSATISGNAPVTWSGTNSVTQPLGFSGRNVTFNYATTGSSVTNTRVLNGSINMEFGTNSDDTKHSLGSEDISTHELTADNYTFSVTMLESDRTNYDDFINNTSKKFDFTISTTDRHITGTTITNPSIKFEVPIAKITEHSEDSSLDDLIKENLSLKALKRIGTANAPMTLTILNSVSSY